MRRHLTNWRCGEGDFQRAPRHLVTCKRRTIILQSTRRWHQIKRLLVLITRQCHLTIQWYRQRVTRLILPGRIINRQSNRIPIHNSCINQLYKTASRWQYFSISIHRTIHGCHNSLCNTHISRPFPVFGISGPVFTTCVIGCSHNHRRHTFSIIRSHIRRHPQHH